MSENIVKDEIYGVAMTAKGLQLIARIIATKASLTLVRVMMGSGTPPEGTYIGDLEDLVEPITAGTVSEPVYKGSTVEMTVEYRSDMNGGLQEGFIIREFGIFAKDPDADGEVMILYGNLSRYPQYIAPYTGSGLDIRRYPVSITVAEGTAVILEGLPSVVITMDDIKDYCETTLLPLLLENVEKRIMAHNNDKEAHQDIRDKIDKLGADLAEDIRAVKTVAEAAKKTADALQTKLDQGCECGGGGGGSVLKITFAAGFKGQTYTVTGGDETMTGTVPDSLVVNVNVKNCNTEYTVSCTAINGGAYTAEVTTGEYFGQYTVELNTFTATLTVTTRAGAVVSVQKESEPAQTETADTSGQAAFTLTSADSYAVSAVYDGVNSDTRTVTPQTDGESLTVTLAFITLTVTADPGSYLTLTNGSSTRTGTTAGASTFYLPNTGDWVVTAALSGQTATETVSVDGYGDFSVALTYYKTIGVTVDESNTNPETAVTYTDDALGMPEGYDAWKEHPIFKKIRPCVVKDGVVQYYLDRDDMTQKEDGSPATLDSIDEGDVMIEFPKLGYKMTTDGSSQFISVTNDPNADGYCYRAHSLDEEGDCDKIYIGAYLACMENSRLYSISGKSPKAYITLTNARTYAQAKGTGYQLVSFYPITLLQCLYLIMYKNRNGQEALGRGYVGCAAGAGSTNTGGSNAQPFCYGETTGKKQMKFLGIEDFWGNLLWWIDGIYTDSSRNIRTAFKDLQDGFGYPYTKESGSYSDIANYMSKIQGTNEGGFLAKESKGSTTTGWTDSAFLRPNYWADFGGAFDHANMAGPFQFDTYYSASYSGIHLGARLIYKHKTG